MGGEHLDGYLAVLRVIDLDLLHLHKLDHDHGVDFNVLREQHAASSKVGTLLILCVCVALVEGPLEFLDNVVGEQRLCDEAVHTSLEGFRQHVIPVVSG